MTISNEKPKGQPGKPKAQPGNSPSTYRPVVPGEFEELLLDEFRVRDVLRLLRREQPLFRGYRRCALAALSAWVVAPDDDELRRSAIATAAAAELKEMEAPAIKGTSENAKIMPLANMLMSQDFLVEIYYPLGGVAAISHAQAPEAIGKLLEKKAVSLSRALLMMHIAHWVFDHEDPHLLPSSVERSSKAAAEILSQVQRTRGTARTLKNDWAQHYRNIAIAYAADSIRITPDRTLLDCFKVGNVGRIKPCHIDDLISRARYLTENVIVNLRNPDTWSANRGYFSDHHPPEKSFPAQPFEGAELKRIVRGYARKKWADLGTIPSYKSRPEITL